MTESIWVVAEIENEEINETTLEILGEAKGLARRLQHQVVSLLLGHGVAGLPANVRDDRTAPIDLSGQHSVHARPRLVDPSGIGQLGEIARLNPAVDDLHIIASRVQPVFPAGAVHELQGLDVFGLKALLLRLAESVDQCDHGLGHDSIS